MHDAHQRTMRSIVVMACVCLVCMLLPGCQFTVHGIKTQSQRAGVEEHEGFFKRPSWFGHRRIGIKGLPEGDDSYSIGVREGCDVAIAIVGEGALRFAPQVIDAERLSGDNVYFYGYQDGMQYCTNLLDWDTH